MATNSEVAAVLADTLAFAAERRRSEATSFITGIAPAGTREIAILEGAGADAGPLVEFLTAVDREAVVQVLPLETATAYPGATLQPNRMIVTLAAGGLLTPQTVAGVQAVLQRPPGTRLIVLVGAEIVQSEEDLDTVVGGIWRVLFGDERSQWVGQELVDYGCLMWSAAPGPAAVDRVGRDAALLRRWLAGAVDNVVELDVARAARALALAERSVSRSPAGTPASRGSRHAVQAAETVQDLRRRVLARLDADVAAIDRETTGSIQMLEQNLLHDIQPHLDRNLADLTSPLAVEHLVRRFVQAGVGSWMAQTVSALHSRLNRAEAGVEDLLDLVDWSLINTLAKHSSGLSYPDAIILELKQDPDVTLPDPPIVLGAAGLQRGRWAPALRTVAYGGALAGISLIALGPLIVPAIAAAAVGAAGGGFVERHLEAVDMSRRGEIYARAAVSATIGSLSTSLRSTINQSLAPVRRQLSDEFQSLIQALTTAGLQPQAFPPMSSDHDEARLAALRRRLARAAQADSSPAVPAS